MKLMKICNTWKLAQRSFKMVNFGLQNFSNYVSLDEPPPNLEILVNFYPIAYFPTMFEIKLYNQIIHGSKKFLNLIRRINSLSNEDV